MNRPPQELIDAFFAWYRNDPHATNEDHYTGQVSRAGINRLSRESFVEFFCQFSHAGGRVQSGGPRTASRFRRTIEAHYDAFRAFALEPFRRDFDEVEWLGRIGQFKNFGQGLATIYLNRVDKRRFVILNNKSVKAVKLFGVHVPTAIEQKYVAVREAERQLIEWFPEFDNYYQTDALNQFLIGEKQGPQWATMLRDNRQRPVHLFANDDLRPTPDENTLAVRTSRIRDRGPIACPKGIAQPKKASSAGVSYYRSPEVQAWVLDQAAGYCELCRKTGPFVRPDGKVYLEIHHLVMLSEGGADTPENTAAVCPNCHRNIHHGKDRVALHDKATQIVQDRMTASRGANAR